MKIKITLLVSFLLLTNLLNAQNAYYDALIFMDLNTYRTKLGILESDSSLIISNSALIEKFLDNPFDNSITNDLSTYLPKLRDQYVPWKNRLNQRGNLKEANGLAGAKFSGLSISSGYQSMVIDAVSQIVVEDFENGVNTVFIKKIKDKLSSIPELQAFFPATYEFLQTANPFDYSKLGNDFKVKFEADLKALVGNVRDYISTTPNDPWKKFRENSKFYKPYCLASDIGDKIINGSHPTEILDYLELKYDGNSDFMDYHRIIRAINIIQGNFRKASEPVQGEPSQSQFENVWVQYRDLKKLDDTGIFYVIGLIYQQDPTLFNSLVGGRNIASSVSLYKNTILPTVDLLMIIDNISKKENMTGDDLGQIFSLLIDMIEYLNKAHPFLDSADFASYRLMADKAAEIYTSIAKKDYSTVISNVAFIINEMDKGENSRNQTAAVLKVTSALMTYGSFFTDVLNAKSAEELKTAYRKATVNRGSFMDKRYSLSSLTISAHPGAFWGVEQLEGSDAWKGNIGITVPVGFELTLGTKSSKAVSGSTANYATGTSIKSLKGSSWGLMLSFADIAAVFNYRFNDSESELPSKLTFKQVFSPGVALHYGFRNSPLVLGAGVQYTPELRSVTASSITTQANSFRGFLRLTWDLPLLKIYYKKSKK